MTSALAGLKAPKPSAEGDALHGAKRRLTAAIAAARTMQGALAGERDQSIETAGLLAKNIAAIEFAEQSKRVADAWVAYVAAFADFSAAAQAAGQPFAWNGQTCFSPHEGMRYEAVEGQRIRSLDYDQHALAAAVARSNAGRIQGKIDAARMP